MSSPSQGQTPMTPERWAKVRATFESALDRPTKDRIAFLHFACGADDELRREVESLLSSHHDSPDFLEDPIVDVARVLSEGMMLPPNEAAQAAAQGASRNNPAATRSIVNRPRDNAAWNPLATDPNDPGDELQGYRVGPYEFERCIGKGGMGSVWLATRSDHEYKKRVAVKVVRRGMDSHEILRRFRLERQVLANLEHPNIARLIDGGSTPDGMPFLVMEYVEGTPIDQYCQSNKLSVNARLQLFRAVCSSVQYAHQSLIVHRDIKASNILVNAERTPKLLDFGIAKLLRSNNATLSNSAIDLSQTLPHLRPMTLDYASPEQVRGEAITTATDVYSLGVLLYKLLSGKMPYGADARSFATMQHAIREIEPVRPSDAVLTEDSNNAAVPHATQQAKMPTEPIKKARQRLHHKLSGDLDAIVLKAMAKDPQQRYASAEQFSEDIRRYLEKMPVSARRGTPGYRSMKLLRRNLTTVVAAAILGVAMIVITVLSYRYAQNASQASAAIENRDGTIRRQLMHSAFDLGLAKLAAGDYSAAYESLHTSLAAADELASQETAAWGNPLPDTQTVLASAYFNLGKALSESGAKQSAIENFTKSRVYYQQILAKEPGNDNAKRSLDAVNQAIAAGQGK